MRDGFGNSSGKGIFFFGRNFYSRLVEAIAFVPITNVVDYWLFELRDQFSVSSLYMCLYKKFLPPSHAGVNSMGTIAKVWGSWAPTKVIVFSWQALLGRLPTKNIWNVEELYWKGQMWVVLCGKGRETEDHLLASCPTTWVVWSKVHWWFGMTSMVPSSIGSLFQCFLHFFRNCKHALKGVILIWHVVIWCSGGLGTKEFLGELWLSRRRFLIGFKSYHGNGCYPRRLLRHVYFMSGVSSLSIVLYANLGGI
jgi:hypothetical protein